MRWEWILRKSTGMRHARRGASDEKMIWARQFIAAILAVLTLSVYAHGMERAAGVRVVQAPVGAVKGLAADSFVMFRGIPYAEPPAGIQRWRAPIAKADWDGVLDATQFGPACYQPTSRTGSIYAEKYNSMSEDCLSLNIWAPDDVQNAPVFVWIHGGALVSGTSGLSMYDGARMARQGVIVVSINYRLGVLGYLAHPQLSAESADQVSGNYGLQDQIEALRWIKRNIGAFGGDADNVTIAGESAGALSVMYLMASPPAHGLFSKAIAQSAYMISTPSLKAALHGHPSAESAGSALEKQLGAAGIASLRAINAQDLVAGAAKAGFVTSGTVDGHFLPHQLVEIFDRGMQAKVPVLAGFNEGEIRSLRFLLPPQPAGRAEYEAKIEAGYGELSNRFLEIYPSSSMEASMLAATRDAMYGWTAERLAAKQEALGFPSYFYLFDHGYPAADNIGLHAFHAAEIPYVFGNIDNTSKLWPAIPNNAKERALSDAMMGYWVSFARDGAPRADGAPDWPAYGNRATGMVFADVPKVVHGLSGGRYALHEQVVCRRKAAGHIPWTWNVGVAAPPLPVQVAQCR